MNVVMDKTISSTQARMIHSDAYATAEKLRVVAKIFRYGSRILAALIVLVEAGSFAAKADLSRSDYLDMSAMSIKVLFWGFVWALVFDALEKILRVNTDIAAHSSTNPSITN